MKKLRLNKSFISNLTRDEAGKIMGGNDATWEECSDRCSDYCTTPTYGDDATCYTAGAGCPGTGSYGCATDNGCQSDLCPDSLQMTECGPIC